MNNQQWTINNRQSSVTPSTDLGLRTSDYRPRTTKYELTFSMETTEIIVYDKAKYHCGGQFPPDQTIEQAMVHTGMYLGWIIDTGLYSEEFAQDQAAIDAFKARTMTGPQVYQKHDGCFTGDMLNDEGNAFSQFYYDIEYGRYLADYEDTLCQNLPSLYHVKDTWENYNRIKAVIDTRFLGWKKKSGPKPWLFWKR